MYLRRSFRLIPSLGSIELMGVGGQDRCDVIASHASDRGRVEARADPGGSYVHPHHAVQEIGAGAPELSPKKPETLDRAQLLARLAPAHTEQASHRK